MSVVLDAPSYQPAAEVRSVCAEPGGDAAGAAPYWPTPLSWPDSHPRAFLEGILAAPGSSRSADARDGPWECGNTLAAFVATHWDELDEGLKARIPTCFWPLEVRRAKGVVRPGEAYCDSSVASAHFCVHFATQGEHMLPGYPDLAVANNLLSYLEQAYAYFVSGLALPAPRSDGDLGGPPGTIDCYVYSLPPAYAGLAHREERSDTACPEGYSGFIDVSNDLGPYNDFAGFRRTTAHELFHLVQFALRGIVEPWMSESTARRAEGLVWPEIERWSGYQKWFDTPYLPLWSMEANRHYLPHFWFFLEQTLDPRVVRNVWERICGLIWLPALEEELAAGGTSLDNALVQFALWNGVTAERDDGLHYEHGAWFPPVAVQAEHDAFPVVSAALPDSLVAWSTGSNYIRFRGPARGHTLRIGFEGHPALAAYRRVSFLASRGNCHTEWTLAPDADGCATIHIPDWGQYDSVTMIVTNFYLPRALYDLLPYRYSASEEAATILGGGQLYDMASLTNAPDPVGQATEIHFRTTGDAPAHLQVYDVRGRQVRELVNRPLPGGEHRVIWDCRDDAGQPVSDGVYFFKLRIGERQRVEKVVVVR